jgi:2'-5' RNA ligase
MTPLRTFIAVDIPQRLLQAIQPKVDDLREKLGNSAVRWVAVNNIHLTLKFLGDVAPSNLESLKLMLQTETQSRYPFDITLSGLGSFPNSKRPRVLFVGIQAPAELEALQHGIESAAAKLGYESDGRPFSPHLTIGRVNDRVAQSELQSIRKLLDEVKIDSPCPARVDSVHIYKSDLKPGGSVYTKLFSAPLKRGET